MVGIYVCMYDSNSCVAAATFRSSDYMDALSCTNSSLNVCCAVGSWDYNICRVEQNNEFHVCPYFLIHFKWII